MSFKIISGVSSLDKNNNHNKYTKDPNNCGEDSFFICDNITSLIENRTC